MQLIPQSFHYQTDLNYIGFELQQRIDTILFCVFAGLAIPTTIHHNSSFG